DRRPRWSRRTSCPNAAARPGSRREFSPAPCRLPSPDSCRAAFRWFRSLASTSGLHITRLLASPTASHCPPLPPTSSHFWPDCRLLLALVKRNVTSLREFFDRRDHRKTLAPDGNREKPQAVVRIACRCASACGHAAR